MYITRVFPDATERSKKKKKILNAFIHYDFYEARR